MTRSANNKHTIGELQQMQSLSLESKIAMTRTRIKAWVNEYGEDGVYVSFSGGKDSTVLLHIVREMYPEVKAVFVNTGLEYPEIVKFVKTFDNVDIIRPKMNFRQVIEKYGYPFISKEVSECVYGARKYLTSVIEEMNALDRQTDRQTPYQYRFERLCGLGEYAKDNKLGYIWQAIQKCQKTGIGGGGRVRDFANLTGVRVNKSCTIDCRLWENYRQFAGTETDGDQPQGWKSDDGEYP